MAVTCPSCGQAFEPAVRIRGGRCERCRAADQLVEVGDRFGRMQFRLSPWVVEVERVPAQPSAVTLGSWVVLGWALAVSIAMQIIAWKAPIDVHAKLFVATLVIGGLQGLVAAMKWVPLARPHALVARREQLELGRWSYFGWRALRTFRADRIHRFAVRETTHGYGVVAQLADGRELVLAADLTEPDDAKRLTIGLREVLQISADEPLQLGARPLAPVRVEAPRELRVEPRPSGFRARVPGLRALQLEADDDGIRVQRRFAHAVKLDVDDVRSLDAEEFVAKPGGRRRYRVVARLRRGSAIVAPELETPQLAQFLRAELARALGLEKG